MPFTKSKVGLKLKWARYYVLSGTGIDDVNANCNNIIKDTKSYVPVVTLLARDNQNLSKLLSKRFQRPIYWNKYKTKNEDKSTTNDIFSNQTLL